MNQNDVNQNSDTLPSYHKANIGKRIVFIREELGLSQPKFSELIGISQTFLSRLENGHSEISGELVAVMSIKTKYSADYILKGERDHDIMAPDIKKLIRAHLSQADRLLDEG